MPIAVGAAAGGRKYRVPGLYASLQNSAALSLEAVDARVRHADYVPQLDAASRRLLNSTSKVTTAAARRLRSFDAGEPQLVPVAAVIAFPGALDVPWIAATREVPDTTAEYDGLAWLMRVEVNDRVTIGQTRGQMWAQAALVADGFTVGRVAADGEYVPMGFNPETQQWQDIAPGDDVVFGDVPEPGD